MSYISDFERCWKKFTNTLGGALIEESEKQNLTYSAASIILSNASMAWSLSYDECGRWLSSYKKENPEKGELAAISFVAFVVKTRLYSFSPILIFVLLSLSITILRY